ncbi:MAG: hypothetical protein M1829_006907 [Trizodia sp. TS-e1964]|nr:MAG: hypothetical protein M1829_006907 [Trizodia sp. TS-e1964]
MDVNSLPQLVPPNRPSPLLQAAHNRHSRRSNSSLNHLSLTPRTPISDDELLDNTSQLQPRLSYIEGKSAPATPSILSRNSSSTRLQPSQGLSLSKSKSSSHITSASQHARDPQQGRLSKAPRTIIENAESSEWLQRAGALISSEARESKGQSWLVSRASSTSLIHDEDDERGDTPYSSFADDEYSPFSARNSLAGSRLGSHINSAERLWQDSSICPNTPSLHPRILRDASLQKAKILRAQYIAEPDFVNPPEEDSGFSNPLELADITQLARLHGFGLGGWINKLIGWPLFTTEEEEDVKDTKFEPSVDGAQAEQEKGEYVRKSRKDNARVVLEKAAEQGNGTDDYDDASDQGTAWKDAAWLLSVAAKAIL